jgi:hypothetical protein
MILEILDSLSPKENYSWTKDLKDSDRDSGMFALLGRTIFDWRCMHPQLCICLLQACMCDSPVATAL